MVLVLGSSERQRGRELGESRVVAAIDSFAIDAKLGAPSPGTYRQPQLLLSDRTDIHGTRPPGIGVVASRRNRPRNRYA